MLPTVADVLALEVVRRGEPRVVAGATALEDQVRWVHVSELADIAHLLHGGELVLTTGVALPEEPQSLETYIDDLVQVGASGLMVELGRRYTGQLPRRMIAAADRRRFPLVVLEREVRFVEITEAVHGRIINDQIEQLRASEQLHETFTTLSLRGAGPNEIVAEVQRLSGRPVVLENLAHQVLVCESTALPLDQILVGWETVSRKIAVQDRTTYDPETGLLVTTVGAKEEDWGRLCMLCNAEPTPHQMMLVERAANTLALSQLIRRDRERLHRRAHRTILTGLVNHAYTDQEFTARAWAMGVPTDGRNLVGAIARLRGQTGQDLDTQSRGWAVGEALAHASQEAHASALVGSLDDNTVAALLTLPHRTSIDAVLAHLATRVKAADNAVIFGVGTAATATHQARRTLLEAQQVADAIPHGNENKLYYRLSDLGVRGLLHLLREDSRLQTFAERQLGPLLAHDAQESNPLAPVLTAYLSARGNKSVAADIAHISRPTLYEKLHHIERILDIDLSDPERYTSLHVALLALETIRDAR